jgi:hypothetical protein
LTLEHLIGMALGNTAPQVAFIFGLLYVIYKLGALWITGYFERIAPIEERQVAAIEKLAQSAEKFSENIARELRTNSIAVRALWQEWEERCHHAGEAV